MEFSRQVVDDDDGLLGEIVLIAGGRADDCDSVTRTRPSGAQMTILFHRLAILHQVEQSVRKSTRLKVIEPDSNL